MQRRSEPVGSNARNTPAFTPTNRNERETVNNNLIYGSSGNNVISGGDGYDVLTYQNIQSAITLSRGGTILKEDQNIDQITDFSVEKIVGAKGYDNTIDGSTGSTASINVNSETGQLTINGLPGIGSASIEFENFSSIIGSQNEDTIIGSRNSEQLSGAAGNDYIKGGAESDLLTGGIGNDIFSFMPGDSTLSNWDIITDFSPGEDFIQWNQEITQMTDAGFVNSLQRRDIAEHLEAKGFAKGTAVLMRTLMPNEEIERSFLMINDSTDGFQGRGEAMIEITGFAGLAEQINFI